MNLCARFSRVIPGSSSSRKKDYGHAYRKMCLGQAVWMLLLLFAVHPATGKETETLRFASTHWCPYICDTAERPGFIVEFMRDLLATEEITLQVDLFPWSRAIALARQGHYQGLLTAVDNEAPDFILTRNATGYYQMCFFTRPDTEFSYSGPESLQPLRLGGIQDYGYGEPLDSLFREAGDNPMVLTLSSASPLQSLVSMLQLKRIDTFIEDRAVIIRYLQQHPDDAPIRQAGCLGEIPFYTALSPALTESEQLRARLDRLLGSDEARQLYRETAQRYGLD